MALKQTLRVSVAGFRKAQYWDHYSTCCSSALDPIMFADDTNLFYEHKDVKTLFSLVNQELQKINEWFEANKPSLNVGKTKYSIFHKPSSKNDLPLLLPRLQMKKHKVERVKSIKLLGVLLDENLSLKDHIKYIRTRLTFLSVAIFNAVSMYQIRHNTAPLKFSGSFEKICHGYPKFFYNLTIKFLKPHLAKANLESSI